jgi:HEAT repeat protein
MKVRVLLFALASVAFVAAGAGVLTKRSQETQAETVVNQMLSSQRPPDLELLREMGPRALPPLLKALSAGHPSLERAYGMVVYSLPDCLKRRLPQLLGAQARRLNAAAWAGYLGASARPAVPYLIKLLKDDVADANAAHSLGMLRPEARDAVPALLFALGEHRPFAATALASIGTPEMVGPALEAASQNGPAWQQEEAKSALRKLRARFPG